MNGLEAAALTLPGVDHQAPQTRRQHSDKIAVSANARKVYGHIDAVRDGSVVVLPIHFDGDEWCHYTRTDKRDAISVPAAFPIDADWCLEHLGQAADVLIVDGHVVRVQLRPIEEP